MAAAASEQEQGNEVEITPAITDPEQQRVEERDAMIYLDYKAAMQAHLKELVEKRQRDNDNVPARIKDLLREAQELHARISQQLLGPARDVRRYCLAFIETELNFILALFTTLELNPQLCTSDTWKSVIDCLQKVGDYARYEIYPYSSCRRLLQRAAPCFRRRNSDWYSNIQQLCGISQYTCTSYMHLLVTSSDHWLTPQLDRTCALPLVGRDDERLPEWLREQRYYAFSKYPSDQSRLLSLYMSMFPYGYKFEKHRPILKWIHEGLIHQSARFWSPSEVNEAKSIAEKFFSQLVGRNVITCVASNCKHKQDQAESCQWHVDLYKHESLASKSAEMGFIFTTATLKLSHGNETSSRMPRRLLALHHPDPQLPSLLETMDLSQTRSLAVSGAVSEIPLHRFISLVVLDFEGWENLKDEDLLQVCRSKLFFLRYLSVRNTRVSKLPHEIKELQSLWTLDVSQTQIIELPLQVFQLTHLWHLDLRGTRIDQLPKELVGLRDSLSHLLVGGEGIINKSVETATRMPHEILRFRCLQTLATVDVTEHPAIFIRALGDLRQLRVLAITWSFHQSTECCEALLLSIAQWKRLESLTIHCGLGCSMEFLGFLAKSFAPRWLEKFKVTAGRFARVPQWIHGLEDLSFVQITVTKQGTDDLKRLGDLPELQCLILGLDFIPGQAIVIEDEGFSKLQRFSIDCPMPWLIFQTGAMPRLTQLQLKFSSGRASKERVPSGISNLERIREVVLSYSKWCANSTSVKMTVKAVREQVAKHRNPIDLFINGVEYDGVQAVDEEAKNATGTSWSVTDAGPGRDDVQAVDEETTGVSQTEITEAES